MDARTLLDLLEQTARLPTAPYHEGEVIAHVERWCEGRAITATRDAFGNVVLRVGDADEDSLAFSAHMDHPGFEITDTSGALVKARWWGGVEPDYFAGAKVRVFSDPPTTGVCVRTDKEADRRRVETMYLDLDGDVRAGDLGMWKLLDWEVAAPLVHTHAADDLAGCAAVLGALSVLATDGVDAWGLFTRAEEVGFQGALGAMKNGSLPAGVAIVALEASKAVAGVRQGGGPVVRVGDKNGVFVAGLCRFLADVAESIHDRYADFEWQRALMDGGTCEATAYSLFGHPSAGLAVPLGNYHNRLDEDGKKRLAAETIHIGDFYGVVTLMVEAARAWKGSGATSLTRYKNELLERADAGLHRLANDGLAGG